MPGRKGLALNSKNETKLALTKSDSAGYSWICVRKLAMRNNDSVRIAMWSGMGELAGVADDEREIAVS